MNITMFHNKDKYMTVLTTLTIIEIVICLAFNMYESFVTKITNDFMVNILMIVLIIKSFIELYGIHKKTQLDYTFRLYLQVLCYGFHYSSHLHQKWKQLFVGWYVVVCPILHY